MDQSADRTVRLRAPLEIGLTVVLLGVGVYVFATTMASPYVRFASWDYGHYLDAATRWLDTGTPYLASEVAAPFDYGPLTFLHPPISLVLFTPFLWLPALLWWLIPLVTVAVSVYAWRPARWTWPLMALALAWPRFTGGVIVGNSDMWVMAFLALGLRFASPLALLALKPTFLPFALFGIRDRWTWIGGAIVLVACVPFGFLWIDWLAVVRNAPGGIGYSVLSIPTVILPLWAWLGRTRFRHENSRGTP